MKIEGLSPDRVAYNALFSALRKAKDGEKVSLAMPLYSIPIPFMQQYI